ncbi:MAG: uracil-DNA glycosylase [Clostridia bacterium]|nr:uracil-DNA glycosylase [Clostridia bacterium]
MKELGGGWDELLAPLFADEQYKKIRDFLLKEYSERVIYPDMYDLYNCFRYTPLNEVKAVILGQDPYHEPNQAHGLCFSVKEGVALPPSLQNIYKEIESDLGIKEPRCGDLTKWAKEGVLLLNTTLTVREHAANSHQNCGWAWFTDNVIKLVSDNTQNTVFILWGGNARSKVRLIDQNKHLILQCAHPSPLSAYNGFFGCKHFSKANEYLAAHGKKTIDWDLNK